jgi:hypothetical protein
LKIERGFVNRVSESTFSSLSPLGPVGPRMSAFRLNSIRTFPARPKIELCLNPNILEEECKRDLLMGVFIRAS